MPHLAEVVGELGDAVTMIEAAVEGEVLGPTNGPKRRELLDGAIALTEAAATRLAAAMAPLPGSTLLVRATRGHELDHDHDRAELPRWLPLEL